MPTLIDRLRGARLGGALWVLVASTIGNVLAYGYQVVMARLLVPADYAALTALFGIVILESLSAQVIQSATARLAATYHARGEDLALRVFVRRWTRRVLVGAGLPAAAVVIGSPAIAAALSLPAGTVALLGVTLFVAAPLTFTGGLLQGLAKFSWFGWYFIVQAAARLVIGVGLVVLGFGVTGAFIGALAALVAGVLISLVPLSPLFRSARAGGSAGPAAKEAEFGPEETRFFLLASVIMLAYAGLTNLDAILVRSLLPAGEAGAYAATITMAKVVLFAPIAVGFILLERTARAQARDEDTHRPLFVALAFVLATSGAITLGYLIAPAFLTGIVVGDQYPLAATLIGPYAVAALLNALLSLWIAHFIGRGQMRFGVFLAVAVAVELALLVAVGHDAQSVVRIVLGIAVATQAAAVLSYARERRHAAARVDTVAGLR